MQKKQGKEAKKKESLVLNKNEIEKGLRSGLFIRLPPPPPNNSLLVDVVNNNCY